MVRPRARMEWMRGMLDMVSVAWEWASKRPMCQGKGVLEFPGGGGGDESVGGHMVGNGEISEGLGFGLSERSRSG